MVNVIDPKGAVYISGPGGLIASRLIGRLKKYIPVSYRDNVYDKFKHHDRATLVHLASFSNAQTPKSELKASIEYDIVNSITLFENFLSKNPEGRIIYISTAGDMFSGNVTDLSLPSPRSVYSCNKLYNENYLNLVGANSLIFRVGNVWGCDISADRPNGLYDRIIRNSKDGKSVTITCSLDTKICLVHVDDLVDLLIKALTQTEIKKGRWVVGVCSLSIAEIINRFPDVTFRITSEGQTECQKLFIDNSRVRKDFDWTPNRTPP